MRILTALAVPIALLLGACEWITAPELRRLRVVTLTTGGDLDEDGYQISVDGAATYALVVNGTADYLDLPPGTHVVAIVGLATSSALSASDCCITLAPESPGKRGLGRGRITAASQVAPHRRCHANRSPFRTHASVGSRRR